MPHLPLSVAGAGPFEGYPAMVLRATSSRALVRREAVIIGIAAAIAAAVVMGFVVLANGRQSLFRNDAEFFWLVARDPFSDGAVFRPFADEMGSAYRYGRILFPLVAWVLAFGRESLVQWTLMAVDVVSIGAVVTLGAELVARRGVEPRRGLVVLLVPGMWSAVVLAVSEPLVLALMLLAYLLVLDGRDRLVPVLGSLLLLGREAAVIALVPLIVRDGRTRGWWGSIGRWAAVPIPLLMWWAFVRIRVGAWPFLDESVSRREALGPPLQGAWRVIDEGADTDHLVAFVLGGVTVLVGIWVARRAAWFPVSHGAFLFSLLVMFLGANAWRYPGEAIRLLAPAQVLAVLAVATRRRLP